MFDKMAPPLYYADMKRKLHPTQVRLLQLLKENISDPLTVRELQTLLDVSSPSVVQHHIYQLEKNGHLRRNPTNPSDYEVLADEPEHKITYLNLYGLAQCGTNGSLLDGNPIDKIPIATRILGFASGEGFLVRAKGDSMSPTINDRDLVIGRRSSVAENGQIVICVNDGQALIKKIKKSPDETILWSVNREFQPFNASRDFRIEGVVKGVISYVRSEPDGV